MRWIRGGRMDNYTQSLEMQLRFAEERELSAYQQGREDYEKECKILFNENPPMHFTKEQIKWIKERMKLSREQGREDTISELYSKLVELGDEKFANYVRQQWWDLEESEETE